MHNRVLWLESLMAASLVAGAMLARMRRFQAHGWLQGLIVVANAVVIGAAMIPSLSRYWPHISDTPILLVHAIAGSVAEILGIYVILSAGLRWLPERCRFTSYKPWMRLTLAAWLVAFGLGAWTYQSLNGGPAAAPAPPPKPAAPAVTRVTVKNFGFDPPELNITAGTEVEWVDEGGKHSIQADDGSFKSDPLTAGASFKHRFDVPGRFPYYCEFHGSAGGQDMAGVVNVK